MTLPSSWSKAQLGDLSVFEMGQAPPAAFCNFEGAGTTFVKAGEFGKTYPIVREWTTKPLKFAFKGDILICVVGATAGKLNLGIDCAIGRSVAAIRPLIPEMQRIIYSQLRLDINRLRGDATGSAQGVISKQMLSDIEINVPPLQEQRRIADKLDTTLARVDALTDRLARITPLLKRFRQSVLAAATSGRLTEDWRSQNDIASEWFNEPAKELSNLVELDMGFAFKSAEFVDNDGIRLLRGDNIEPGNLRWTDAKKYPEDKFEEKRHILLSCNDIVLAMDRPIISTGLKIAKVKKEDLPCLLVQRVCRFKCSEYLQNDYAYLFLNSQNFIDHLLSVQNGSSVPHISGKQILSYKVKIPSVKEQTEIVRRVESLFAFADRLEARLQTAQTEADRLTPALLAKAFRGELVPQDPNDEPATELLRRLREARAAEAPTKPKRGHKAAAT